MSVAGSDGLDEVRELLGAAYVRSGVDVVLQEHCIKILENGAANDVWTIEDVLDDESPIELDTYKDIEELWAADKFDECRMFMEEASTKQAIADAHEDLDAANGLIVCYKARQLEGAAEASPPVRQYII